MANFAQLASDEDNPEFSGARDPDSLLHVRFYERAIQNNYQTELQGRPIFDNIIFIEIHTPGNQLNIIDRPKCKNDEFRFPKQWARFMNSHSDDPAKQGTPLNMWPLIDVAKAEMLKAMKFFTVEQVAYASDEQINNIGMLAGMAPHAFRDRAKAYLDVAKDANAVSKKDEALRASETRLAELEAKHKAEMDELNAKLNAVLARMAQPDTIIGNATSGNAGFTTPIEPIRKYVMTAEHKAKLKAAREKK